MLGGEAARALFGDEAVVDHRADGCGVNLVDLLHLVRGAETVEEMHERHARLERGGMGDERQVLPTMFIKIDLTIIINYGV